MKTITEKRVRAIKAGMVTGTVILFIMAGIAAPPVFADYELYAGGDGTTTLSKFDGTSWTPMNPDGIDGVMTLATDGSNIYAGGYGTTKLSKFDGTSWTSMNPDGMAGLYSLAIDGSNIYAGGYGTNSVSKFDGTSWTPMNPEVPSGYSFSVRSLVIDGSNIYAGGEMRDMTHYSYGAVSKYDGTSWTYMNPDGMFSVESLVIDGSNIYAGGGAYYNTVSKFDGTSWTPMGSGFSLYSLAVDDESNIYAGGGSTVSKYDGTSWTSMDLDGMNTVRSLATDGSNVYVGGREDGVVSGMVKKFNGTSWTSMDLDGVRSVYSLMFNGLTTEELIGRAIADFGLSGYSQVEYDLLADLYRAAGAETQIIGDITWEYTVLGTQGESGTDLYGYGYFIGLGSGLGGNGPLVVPEPASGAALLALAAGLLVLRKRTSVIRN